MSRSRAFCDGFTVTTPTDNGLAVMDDLRPFLDSLGYTTIREGHYRGPDGALVLSGQRSGVTWFQVKGRSVALLRARGLLNEFLATISTHPHRVSMADIAVDEYVDSPAKRLQQVYQLAKDGGIGFSQRALKGSQIRKMFAPTLYDDTGEDTGTVYLGNRTAEVRARVYDKTQERAEAGECIGLTVRYEMCITSKMGVSLRDLAEPESCFYHFVPAALLSKPAGVAGWESHSQGFEVIRNERLPAQRLKAKVEYSTDLGEIIALAQSCGPEGMRLLHRLIDQRAAMEGHVVGHA